jgi:hypothetical protein
MILQATVLFLMLLGLSLTVLATFTPQGLLPTGLLPAGLLIAAPGYNSIIQVCGISGTGMDRAEFEKPC